MLVRTMIANPSSLAAVSWLRFWTCRRGAALRVVGAILLGWNLTVSAAVDYTVVVQKYEAMVQEAVGKGAISGACVALVDDQRIVFARGFGYADKARRVPARTDTVYRAGSISKLFTALTAMQLADQGVLDIDRPVTNDAPDFRIVVPFEDAKPITLRQLMCHRSGMIREAPVGGYFDGSEPGVAQTVASIAACVLVYPPGTRTKYSNSGVTVVGHTIARVTGLPFDRYVEQALLRPLAMTNSAFLARKSIRARLAKGYLQVADGRGGFREREAPQFELGILPAGNLYTTAEDLARFLSFLFAGGQAGEAQLVKPAALAEMLTPQLTTDTNAFGLGFYVGHFRKHRTFGHMGAVYGFTSELVGLPEHKLGVVVLCNDDLAVGVVRQLSRAGLALLLEAKRGEHNPASPPPFKPNETDLATFAGDYESESFWARIQPGDGCLRAVLSNQPLTLCPTGPDKFAGFGRLVNEAPFVFERDSSGGVCGFTVMNQKFRRIDPVAAPPLPAEWRRVLGSYGPDFIPLIVTAKHGKLYAMTENEYDYRLTPLTATVFKMPPGLYEGEHLVFQPDSGGRIHHAVLANMPLVRR
jgi:serine beta-lactamase-like protein LACTB